MAGSNTPNKDVLQACNEHLLKDIKFLTKQIERSENPFYSMKGLPLNPTQVRAMKNELKHIKKLKRAVLKALKG